MAPKRAGRADIVRTLRRIPLEVSVADEPYAAVAQFIDAPAKLVVVELGGLRRRDRSFILHLRRYSPDLRVLLLVPPDRRADATPFLKAGADSILPSPVLPGELRLVAEALLRSDGTDPLTDLPNRAAIERAAEREISRAKRQGTMLGIAVLDIDHFTRVNTKHGHGGGDQVLREFARRVQEPLRITDLLGRWGGEEFVVVLTGLDPAEAVARERACMVLDRIRAIVAARPFALSTGEQVAITVSGGLALYPVEGEDLTTLFNWADRRLGVAKGSGRDLMLCSDEVPDRESRKEGDQAEKKDGAEGGNESDDESDAEK